MVQSIDRDPAYLAKIDARVEALMQKMTLEEIILQTDQYFSPDFTRVNEMGDVESIDTDKLHALLRGNSVGSIQARGMTPEQINELQRYAVERTRLGIPFLFSEEALHGLNHRFATCFPRDQRPVYGLSAADRPCGEL